MTNCDNGHGFLENIIEVDLGMRALHQQNLYMQHQHMARGVKIEKTKRGRLCKMGWHTGSPAEN